MNSLFNYATTSTRFYLNGLLYCSCSSLIISNLKHFYSVQSHHIWKSEVLRWCWTVLGGVGYGKNFRFNSVFKQAESNCSYRICREFIPNGWCGNREGAWSKWCIPCHIRSPEKNLWDGTAAAAFYMPYCHSYCITVSNCSCGGTVVLIS